jgi:transposase
VVYTRDRRIKVVKHLGTAHDQKELKRLVASGEQFVLSHAPTPLFPELFKVGSPGSQIVSLENLSFTNTYHMFAHEFLDRFYALNGFGALNHPLLRDLAFMRILEPTSKLRSIELCNKFFGTMYTRNWVFKRLPEIRLLKPAVEKAAVSYAQQNLEFDFSVVFYDVTTLYFETFQEEGLRRPGYSKDNKSNQPQVIIGLVVTPQGYPVAADLFAGNTFEGHTVLPVLDRLKKAHGIKALTVVADAAMLSLPNLDELKQAGLHYIIGARLGNLAPERLREISYQLAQSEGIYATVETKHGRLICDYSRRRAHKDRSDRQKQILKAQDQIAHPTKVKKRSRFVLEKKPAAFELNQSLIEQDELREGIKGYYSNLEGLPESLIVSRYKELWQIEKSFRIAKSDLVARPIFHRKQESIETHLLIVFVSLCLAKSIELQTGLSVRKVKDLIWDIQDIEFIDRLTNTKYLRRMDDADNSMVKLINNWKTAY